MEKEDCQLRLLRDWMEEGLAHFILRGMFLGRCMGEREAGKTSHEILVNKPMTLPGGVRSFYLACTYPTSGHLIPVGVCLFNKHLFSPYYAPGAF